MSGISVGSPPADPAHLVGQAIWAKLAAGLGGVIEIVGDSTSDGAGEWQDLMGQAIAARLPSLRVETVTWGDGGSSWPSPTVLQAGSGSFGTLTIYNCSVGGKATHYFLAPYFNAMVANVQPDLVFINLGHNEGNTATAEPFWRDDLLGLGETISRACPKAEIVVLTQNPRNDAGAANQAARRHVTMQLARMRGWGVIDTFRLFLAGDGSVDTSLLVDALHPNAAGEALIWSEMLRRFQYVPGSLPRAQAESSLLRPATTALANADFASFAAPPTLPSWAAPVNCTPSKDLTNFEGPNGYSVRLASTSAAVSHIEQSITGSALKPFLGQFVCFAARLRIPTGQNSNVGRVHIRTTGGSNTISLNSLATADGQGDFRWAVIGGRVDPSAGTLVCRVYCENGTTNTGDVSIDRVCLAQGLLPRDLR